MANRYSLKQIKTLPNGMYRLEKNFYLFIHDNRRAWLYIFSYHGKQHRLGLGSALSVPYNAARELKNQAQAILLSGRNPIDVRKEYRQKVAADDKTNILFKDYWEKTFKRIVAVKNWRNIKHTAQWKSSVDKYALPILGDMKVKDITRGDILQVLEPIWNTKNETASRVRARLEIVLSYAVVDGLIAGGNPATWKSNLDLFLPSSSKVQEVKHFAALSYSELKTKLKLLKPQIYISHALILFTILTAARIGESAPARWSEIDFENKIWSVPPERRKDKKKYPHRVPLSIQAMRIIENLPRLSDYIFPANDKAGNKGAHVSRETPRVIIQRVFKTNATMHGMRSTFRDFCAETGIRDIVAEKSLMHAYGNEVVQAYQRSDLLELRRIAMQQWADYLLGKPRRLKKTV